VAVRDLDTKHTELISARYDPATGRPKLDAAGREEAVPANSEGVGAVYPGGALRPPFPGPSFAGATISADGSTVAWLGQNVGEQAAALANDRARAASYTEPLWRRIADGPYAPTRRVTGGSDPFAPGCIAELGLAEPPTLADPCQGPFDTNPPKGGGQGGTWLGANGDYLPRLSADGNTVAFIAGAREIAGGEEFRAAEASDDLYVSDMRSGLTRVAALRRLTELAGGNANDTARVAPIYDLDVSPDGDQIAFTSQRTVFPLGSPAYVSPPAAEVGVVELFDVDLANNTLTRVTHGFGGEGDPSQAANGPAGLSASPSFAGGGNSIAFASDADNLVFGDGNAASDVFLVHRRTFSSQTAAQEISPAPPNPTLNPSWQIGLSARSRRDGSVLLYVRLPGAGNLRAGAAARVLERRSRRPRGRRGRATVAVKTVASAQRLAPAPGLIVVTLRLGGHYAPLARRAGGLSAKASVLFAAPAHRVLRQSIAVHFLRTLRAHRARHHARKGGRRR
jgi:WD40 repeat protein